MTRKPTSKPPLRPAALAAAALLGLLAGAAPGRAEGSCKATGVMAGTEFSAGHCAAAILPGENSVTIWFNEAPIPPEEREAFAMSAYASSIHEGKERTMLLVAFCPGGGAMTPSPGAVRSLDLGLSHAQAPLAGAQWLVDEPKEFAVESLAGEIVPGGRLAGRITGQRTSDGRPYRWDLAFDLPLPTQEAASGVTCGK